jgi:primosomal protein N' (replication factor Y)
VPCGPGIERIAEEVAERFPDARRVLLSSDLTPSISDLRETLREIEEREVDIVIGTQLVAKGHHFPGLALVGVVDADLGLAQADPRAAERTFQLMSQVTGRAGRDAIKGHGLIQTYMPEHPVIAALVSGDRDTFLEREIAERRKATMPPFGRLAALLVSAGSREACRVLRARGRACRSRCRQDPCVGTCRSAARGDPRPLPLPATGEGRPRSRPPGLPPPLA